MGNKGAGHNFYHDAIERPLLIPQVQFTCLNHGVVKTIRHTHIDINVFAYTSLRLLYSYHLLYDKMSSVEYSDYDEDQQYYGGYYQYVSIH